ncbi:DUF3784 domain-containing protein [Bacillus salacetis]|uniref:DUF3784 domain-containing protein n=1 Tax=Bacillus salacetis TaxID=2315464 RepID=UPI003B9EE01B
MIIGLLICGIAGVLIIYFGYLIWKKKKLHFIAGYSEDDYKGNKGKLAKVFGIYFSLIGIITVFLPFSIHYIGLVTGTVYLFSLIISGIPLAFFVMWKQMKS